ncbi:hypothetical protein ES703_58267 [subsurface metagenome]
MKDRLEEFISDNRDQFDLYEPDEKLWSGIESDIRPRRTHSIAKRGIIYVTEDAKSGVVYFIS